MKEIWKGIPGYKDIYEASSLGRIRTKEGKITFTERHGVRHWKSRILKYRGENNVMGNRVSLWLNGKSKDWLVHRLVAFAFLGVPRNKLTVNHKNGNRLDNRIENLEWLSLADNIRHGFDTGLYPQIKTTLISEDGKHYSFRSLSQASKFLNRSHGYLSNGIKKNRIIRDVEGNKYKALIDKIA